MTTDFTLNEIKRMLNGMLRDSLPTQCKVNKQEQLDSSLDHIYRELVTSCYLCDFNNQERVVIQTLNFCKHRGALVEWNLVSFPTYFLIQVTFGLEIIPHELTISRYLSEP